MPRSHELDPLKSFRFIIEVDGIDSGGFMTCDGLEKTTDAVEYREGDDTHYMLKSPGLSNTGNITLKRGLIRGDSDFNTWVTAVDDPKKIPQSMEFRKDFTIVLKHRDGDPGKTWDIFDAFPVRHRPSSDLDATTSDNAIEELEIAYEYFVEQL